MSLDLTIGLASDPGQKRSGKNQDCVGIVRPGFFNHRPPLLILADGMGGYNGGEVASQTVVRAMSAGYRGKRPKGSYLSLLINSLEEVHKQIKRKSRQDAKLATMGSTVVALVVDWPDYYLINVGDSRAYRLHDHQLEQISADHSQVAEMVQKGEITKEEALSHPKRNILTMSISAARDTVIPYTSQSIFSPGDCILLCSDGLWSVVPESEIVYYLENFTPQEAADDLVKLANTYGGPDNVSIIVARWNIESRTSE